MPKEAPKMSLLIGVPKKGAPTDKPPMDEMSEHQEDSGGGDKEEMENSAISDFMSAKSPEEAKAALKDFLELCYPELGGEPDGDEPGAY